jgi:hypothetical protein
MSGKGTVRRTVPSYTSGVSMLYDGLGKTNLDISQRKGTVSNSRELADFPCGFVVRPARGLEP